MQTGAVEFDLFVLVASGIVTGGIALAGYVLTRQAMDNRALTKRVVALERMVDVHHQAGIERHDNGLGDLWQALEAHRVETRQVASRQEERAFKFREASLSELGTIKASLARLESRFFPPAPIPEPGE